MATQQEKRRNTDSWHFDKKVPLGLIVAMLLQTGGVFYAYAELRKDIEYLRLQVHVQEQRDNRQDADMKEAMSLLRESLGSVNSKLDRLIERGVRR